MEVKREFDCSISRIPPPCSGCRSFSEFHGVCGHNDVVSNIMILHLGDLVPRRFPPKGDNVSVFVRVPFQLSVFPRDRSDKSEFSETLRRVARASVVLPLKTNLLYRLCVPRSLHDVAARVAGSLHCCVQGRRLRGFPTGAVLVSAPALRRVVHQSSLPRVAVSYIASCELYLSRSFGTVQRPLQD